MSKPIDPNLRLYTVTLETEVVVLAESSEAAEEIARNRRGDEDLWDAVARPMKRLPSEWDMDSCPYADAPTESLADLVRQGCAPEFEGTP